MMRKLYEEREILFALLWILAYCFVMAPVKGNFGLDSIWVLLTLLAFAAGITFFVKSNHLEAKYGVAGWPDSTKKYLYFIPVWILATGNLWDGIALSYHGIPLATAILSMILVGYIEEMFFRGFLFKAMLTHSKADVAVVVSAVTFGIGHIVNLFAGQAGFDTVLQIVFAVSWGFVLTMVFYKSGSLIPCIIAHAAIDIFSLLGADSRLGDRVYIGATIVSAIIYCIYLNRLERKDRDGSDQLQTGSDRW